jgi:pyruvate,water dikinase
VTHTVEYTCADGTPFPVTFDSEADAQLEWRLDREHAPDAQTPLAEAVGRRGESAGARQAYEDSGMRWPSTWKPGPRANGFLYFGAAPPAPEDLASMFEGGAKLVQQYGSAIAVWESHCLPSVRAACAWLEQAPLESTFDQLADRYDYALQLTMVAGMISSNDRRLLQESVADAVGDDGNAEALANALWHGYESPTLASDVALWHAARADGAGELESFMDRYGAQATTWSVDAPTLREAPEIVASQLEMFRRTGAENPQQAVDRAAARRRKVVEEVDARLAGDDARRARFHRRVERAARLLWIREDRALWQLIAVGALRHAFLRRGAQLVDAGLLGQAADVFYLEPNEFDGATGDLRESVRVRREETARWRAVTPPPVIGGNAPAASTGNSSVVRGVAGAPGTAEGPARVILDLAEADRFGAGDVLVCTMTSPPWTPLLGVAAALVTDGGDVMSHASIAAREYGLPCVVGTGVATSAISDGDWVRVDGDAGTVEIGRG